MRLCLAYPGNPRRYIEGGSPHSWRDRQSMRVAVLGAGSTALANAWLLAQGGHEVRIWSAFEAERRALASAGGISAEGIMSGTVGVTVAPDTEGCLKGASFVIIAAPAFAHRPL